MQGAVQATGLATLLLALSLAGAFHLVESVFAIKWRVKRQKEQALYLAYLYWAAVLAIAAALIISLLPNLLWLVDATRLYASEAITMPEIWTDHDWTPEFEYQPVSTGVVAFLLGHALPPIANRWLDEIESIGRAVDDSVFEKTLFEAQLDGTPVMYTLKNRQVYVGFTFGLPDPSKKEPWIQILPLKSGLRDESTYKVNFRVEYSDLLAPFFGEERDFDADYAASTWLAKSPELLEQCEEENSFEPVLRRFTVLIAVEEIVNAHPYDSAAYEAFQDLLVVTPPQ